MSPTVNQNKGWVPGTGERRKYFRRDADNKIRVRLVSGEFDDPASSVNFAKRLINYTQAGACVETTGRLRPDIKMKIELKFEAFGGHLRSQVQVIWAETRNEGASEVHLVGMRFVGPELTNAVRDFFEGDRASLIVTRRKAEYEELKAKSTARKNDMMKKKWSTTKKSIVFPLLLILVYIGSFGAFVGLGRTNPGGPGIRFQYVKGGSSEETLAKVYWPLMWAAQKAGVDLAHDASAPPKP
jgi:hypothetical protein